jgi:hypothetical protein
VQASGDAHATPSNAAVLRGVPDGSGSIDQRWPFQPSISGRPFWLPTAMHPVADQHATLDKMPSSPSLWLDQRLPFHRSTALCWPLASVEPPTAKQATLAGQETPFSASTGSP